MRQDILNRHAVQSDLSEVKRLADENRKSLGIVIRSALAFGIENQWLLVAVHQGHLPGFAHYRHRQDTQTTFYELCVQAQIRKQGIGKALLLALRAQAQGKTYLVLKTPPAQSIKRRGTFAVGLASLDACSRIRGHFLTQIR
jgi:N-acetylglutamate synthase-like GNAT family acetyltransferase